MKPSMNLKQARVNMLKHQLYPEGVVDKQVLKIMFAIPRELFIPVSYGELAFADMVIPLGHGRAMMSPKETGKILQTLQVQPTDKALVIGMDGGYMIALLAKLAHHVYGIDTDPNFIQQAEGKLGKLGISNTTLKVGNLLKGWEEYAPYDVVVLMGSLLSVPQALQQNLSVGGRLFAVLGRAPAMEATLVKRLDQQHWEATTLFETVCPRLPDAKEVNFEF